MIFADADVLADQGAAQVPPLEIRLGLQPGDKVGLYQVAQHHSMGSGYSPIEAIILGSPEPGWFIGETEDGCEIQFHAGNVMDVEYGSPSLGGLFDWFKKKEPPPPSLPLPGTVISLPSGPVQPGVSYQPPPPPPPPPPPGESRGLIEKIKTMFIPAEPTGEQKSVFDFFKPKSGLPAVKKPSMFAFLRPGAKTITPWSKVFQGVALPKGGPSFLTPYIKKIEEVFKFIPMPPPPGPPQKPLWEGMFEKPTEEEIKQEEQSFRAFKDVLKRFEPAEVQPPEEVVPPTVPQRMHRKMKILPIPRRRSLFPSVEEVARGLMGLYNPIEELWDMLRNKRSKPKWAHDMEKYGFAKERWETVGTCGGPPTVFEELAALMHIPWEEFRNRAEIVDRGEEGEEWVGDDNIWLEIVFPATELMSQAFELIKPPDLPGHFGFEREEHPLPDGSMSYCMLVVTYTEGDENAQASEQFKQETKAEREEAVIPPLEEGVYEQWKEDNNAESPEEIIAKLQADDIEFDKALTQMETEIGQLVGNINSLDKESGTFKDMFDELRSQIEYRKELMQGIAKALSGLEPTAKPEKKQEKPAKGGKKRKK